MFIDFSILRNILKKFIILSFTVEDEYLGCHALTGNEINEDSLPPGTDYEECRTFCLDKDYSMMVIEDLGKYIIRLLILKVIEKDARKLLRG